MEIGLFHFSIPQVPYKAIPDLFLSAFAIAILALIQTISVEKPLAMAREMRELCLGKIFWHKVRLL